MKLSGAPSDSRTVVFVPRLDGSTVPGPVVPPAGPSKQAEAPARAAGASAVKDYGSNDHCPVQAGPADVDLSNLDALMAERKRMMSVAVWVLEGEAPKDVVRRCNVAEAVHGNNPFFNEVLRAEADYHDHRAKAFQRGKEEYEARVASERAASEARGEWVPHDRGSVGAWKWVPKAEDLNAKDQLHVYQVESNYLDERSAMDSLIEFRVYRRLRRPEDPANPLVDPGEIAAAMHPETPRSSREVS